MTQRPRILLLIPHLGGGGAEQVTALLARHLSREKYEVHLGLVTGAEHGPESLPAGVIQHAIGAKRVRSAAFGLIQLVRQVKPDVILSGMAHLNFLVLLLRSFFPRNASVVVRQNSIASASLAFGDLPAYTQLLYRLLYHRADRMICQTQAMAEDLTRVCRVSKELMAVLPNPVDVSGIRTAAADDSGQWRGTGPHLLAVGRLAPVKGFDLLLQSLGKVRRLYPTADLTIAGAGPEDAQLKQLARELGLEEAVNFAGHVDQPSTFFSGATLFVLSSRHEGLPNALLETAAGGLPLVATPASEGIVDLLRNQPGVWLAAKADADELAEVIIEALRRLQPGQRFVHSFVEQFDLSKSIQAYERLIDTVLMERRS